MAAGRGNTSSSGEKLPAGLGLASWALAHFCACRQCALPKVIRDSAHILRAEGKAHGYKPFALRKMMPTRTDDGLVGVIKTAASQTMPGMAELDALMRPQAGSAAGLAPWLPSILDEAFEERCETGI